MKITYAVTVCNEFIEIQRLLTFLLEHKRIEDEIVIQMDFDINNPTIIDSDKRGVLAYIMKHQEQGHCRVIFKLLNNDFAAFKNHLTEQCTGDYIFQIDADELPHETLIANLPELLQMNSENEVFLVPRVNTVEGLTAEHVQRWGWLLDPEGRINWPDYQWRIYKNKPEIRWINKVHERLDGFTQYAPLPSFESLSLYHPKTIDRQIKQNEYYDTL
jgi:hypothetical protein